MSTDSEIILVVDDNVANLGVLSDCLDQLGFEVRVARDGQSAIERAILEQPDLILLDVMMPGLDGFETCQRLKISADTQNIPVIFMTALADAADKVKGLTIGAVDYITKPIQQQEVIARVRLHLRLRAMTKKLEAKNARLQEEVERRRTAEAGLKDTLNQLQAAQKQIIAQEKLASLGTLTAGIAHELRNPLNFITNYAEGSIELTQDVLELLETQGQWQQVDNKESLEAIQSLLIDVKDNAAAINRHGRRAERIISSMMQHARTKEADHPQPVDLNSHVDDAVQFAYHSLRAKDPDFFVQFETHYDSSIGEVEVIAADFSRALINLFDNACAAARAKELQQPEGVTFKPKVVVTTRNQGDGVTIDIRDNGVGIPPEIQEKIFDPFFTTKPTGEGTGLGLSLCHDIIVGRHGGHLVLHSEKGEYTEFNIILPKSLSLR